MKYLVSVLFIFFIFSSQAQWQRVPVFSAYFGQSAVFDSSHFVVAGSGRLYYTTDRGKNWNESFIAKDLFYSINQIEVASPTVAYTSGYGSLMKTVDAGKTWRETGSVPANMQYSNMQFVSADTGFICKGGQAENASLFRTVNGGRSWVKLALPLNVSYVNVHFFNGKTGFSCTSRSIYKTTDGGQTWNLRQILPQSMGPNNFIFNLKAIGPNEVFYMLRNVNQNVNEIHVSRNGGLSSTKVLRYGGVLYNFQLQGFKNFGGGRFSFRLNRYLSTQPVQACMQAFYKTTDYGQTWLVRDSVNTDCKNSPLQTSLSDFSSTYIDNINSSLALVSHHAFEAVSLCSRGISALEPILSQPNGDYQSGSSSGMITTNGSFTNVQYKPFSQPELLEGGLISLRNYRLMGQDKYLIDLNSDSYTDPIWVDSLGLRVKRLSLYGKTKLLYAKDSSFVALNRLDSNIILFYPELRKSISRAIPPGVQFSNFLKFFPINDSVYVMGNSYKLYKSQDSAKTWTQLNYPVAHGKIDLIHFLNQQVGMVFGDHISRTTDGGQSWTMVDSTTYSYPWYLRGKVHFFNDSIGLVQAGKILRTTNGGKTWLNTGIDIGFGQMVFNEQGDGFMTKSTSVGYFYKASTQTFTRERIPDLLSPLSFDRYRQQWIAALPNGDVAIRTGQAYKPKANLLVLNESVCPNDSLRIRARFRNIESARVASVQLSDPQGSFVNPVTIGTISLDSSLDNRIRTYAFALPAGLVPGNTYAVRFAGEIDFSVEESSTRFQVQALPQVNAGADQSFCPAGGGMVVGMPASGTWSGEALQTDGILKDNLSPGVYPAVYQVNVSPTCWAQDTAFITILAGPMADSIQLTSNGNLLGSLSPGNSLQWFWEGQEIPNAQDTLLAVTQLGLYWLEVRSPNGCKASSNQILISNTQAQVSRKSVTVYPNPAKSEIHVRSEEAGTVCLLNEWGLLVSQTSIQAEEDKILPAAHLPRGLYVLKIQTQKGVDIRKVLLAW